MCPNNYNSNPTHHRTNQEKDKRRMRATIRTDDNSFHLRSLYGYTAQKTEAAATNYRARATTKALRRRARRGPELRPSPARSPEMSEGFAELCSLPRFLLINKTRNGFTNRVRVLLGLWISKLLDLSHLNLPKVEPNRAAGITADPSLLS